MNSEHEPPVIYSQLAASYLRRSKVQSECTSILLGQMAEYEETGQTAAVTIFAAALHVNMLSHDLVALLLLHSLTDDKWANRAATRMAATVIYEGIDDFQSIFGKRFRDSCAELGILKEIEGDLSRVKKEITALEKKHMSVLKPIRTAAGAHRDHDIRVFLGAFLDESKSTAVVDAAVDLEKCLHSLGGFCTDVMQRIRVAVKK